jgi:hypothetical protein
MTRVELGRIGLVESSYEQIEVLLFKDNMTIRSDNE